MSVKSRTVPGIEKTPGFTSPHAITITAISLPHGESIELECDHRSLQVSFNDIVSLMEAARNV